MGSCMCKNRIVRSAKIKALPVSLLNESHILHSIYTDLSKHSQSGHSIDKATFHEFFRVPVACRYLDAQLFAYFDTENSGELSYERFAGGVKRFLSGLGTEKVRIIFQIYNKKEDLLMGYEEVSSLVQSCWEYFEGFLVFRGKLQSEQEYLSQLDPLQLEVHFTVQHVIDKYGDKDALSFSDFAELVDEHPRILAIFKEIFKCDLWNSQDYLGHLYLQEDAGMVKVMGLCKHNVVVLVEEGVLKKTFWVTGYSFSVCSQSPWLGLCFTSKRQSQEFCVWFDARSELDKWRCALGVGDNDNSVTFVYN